jgi:hypothetical protein
MATFCDGPFWVCFLFFWFVPIPLQCLTLTLPFSFHQDPVLLFQGQWPVFTPCFQETITAWLPCAFLWPMLVYEVLRLRNRPLIVCPFTLITIIKFVSSISY